MGDRSRLTRYLLRTVRKAGREYATSRQAYAEGKRTVTGELPRDDQGRVRIVCRRFAERRAVALDSERRPMCFEAEHNDCEGCLEDVRAGEVETW